MVQPPLPQNVAVVLRIGAGSFADGFPVTLQILEDGQIIEEDQACPRLPAAPKIPQWYQEWKATYEALGQQLGSRQIEPVSSQVTHQARLDTCRDITTDLEERLRNWFSDSAFRTLRDRIQANVKVRADQSVPIMIDCHTGASEQDVLLRKLPWHLWNLFDRLNNAEVALMTRFTRPVSALVKPIRVLAIFGSSEGGLQLDEDREALRQQEQYGAEIALEVQPTREELHQRLYKQSWDILFFAGHSFSENGCQSGYLQIQDGKGGNFPLSALRVDLQRAVERGLKLAIFNSCDGLGIADFLANLNVPTTIVMREPVPDRVARNFLRYFLDEFSQGKPLCLAVREARNRLHWMESDMFPCPAASWLPIICQNPNQPELVAPQTQLEPISDSPEIVRNLSSSKPINDRVSIQPRKKLMFLGLFVFAIAAALMGHVWANRPDTPPPLPDISAQLSMGENSLIENNTSADKRVGIQAFSASNFPQSIEAFRASLNGKRNDPEALIYLNNAIAEQNARTNTSSGKIQIAVSVPVGLDSDIAQEVLRGVATAQSQLNCGIDNLASAIDDTQIGLKCRGGIEGKQLQIEIADDLGNPDTALQVAKKFAADSRILAVIGHYQSKVTQLAIEEVYNPEKLVVIAPTSTSVKLSGYPYLFRTSTSDAIAAQSLAKYAKRQGWSKVAVAHVPDDPFSESLKDEFKKNFPATVIVPACNLSNLAVRGNICISNAIKQGAEAMLLIPDKTDTLDRALRLVKSNEGKLKLLGGDTMYSQRTIDDFGKESASGKLVVAIPWHRTNSNFENDTKKLFSSAAVNWRTAMAYDATQAVIKGLMENSTREGLRQTLSKPDFAADGVTGPGTVKFDPSSHDRVLGINIGVLVKVEEDGSGYSFRHLK